MTPCRFWLFYCNKYFIQRVFCHFSTIFSSECAQRSLICANFRLTPVGFYDLVLRSRVYFEQTRTIGMQLMIVYATLFQHIRILIISYDLYSISIVVRLPNISAAKRNFDFLPFYPWLKKREIGFVTSKACVPSHSLLIFTCMNALKHPIRVRWRQKANQVKGNRN